MAPTLYRNAAFTDARSPDLRLGVGLLVDRGTIAWLGDAGEEITGAVLFTDLCHGCGGCVAECPHNAITQMHFTDAQVLAQIHALLADKPPGHERCTSEEPELRLLSDGRSSRCHFSDLAHDRKAS